MTNTNFNFFPSAMVVLAQFFIFFFHISFYFISIINKFFILRCSQASPNVCSQRSASTCIGICLTNSKCSKTSAQVSMCIHYNTCYLLSHRALQDYSPEHNTTQHHPPFIYCFSCFSMCYIMLHIIKDCHTTMNNTTLQTTTHHNNNNNNNTSNNYSLSPFVFYESQNPPCTAH